MNAATIILLSIALGTDAALVSFSAALQMKLLTFRQGFRLAFHFGLFQGVMTFIGWSGGALMRGFMARIDHWAAFVLLALVGLKMIFESGGDEERPFRDPSRGMLLVTLAVATSLDALAVGTGLAMIGRDIAIPATVIGAVTAAMCAGAIILGRRGRRLPGMERRAALIAGLVLIAIGMKILNDHGVFFQAPTHP